MATWRRNECCEKNDRLGWGIFYPDENAAQDEEQLVICYLTINRQVSYLRVLFQPPGGFYPVVIAPPNSKNDILIIYDNGRHN